MPARIASESTAALRKSPRGTIRAMPRLVLLSLLVLAACAHDVSARFPAEPGADVGRLRRVSGWRCVEPECDRAILMTGRRGVGGVEAAKRPRVATREEDDPAE